MNRGHTPRLGDALARPRYELIPMRGALGQARLLPVGTTVSVTCSPTRGIQPTVELAERVRALGHVAIPHLAARRFESRRHLQDTIQRLGAAGIRDVFVVGGDGKDGSGPYRSGAELIAALAEIEPNLRSVGIPCYPEGHALISAQLLDEAIDDKRFFAGHMVTQMCFDTGVIHDWLSRIRERGVDLPVHIGIPGVIERRRLLGIALRIGLGDSTRFLGRNSSLVGRLAGPSRYTPDPLMPGLDAMLAEPALGVAGLHINAFNEIEKTEVWRRQWLEKLSASAQDAPAVLDSVNGGAG